jgi:aldose 1-epimerase
MAPDKDGKFLNIVQGHDSIDNVINSPNEFLSTLIGRYGNRISNGTFSIDGKEIKLNLNDGKNNLHGGHTGLHARVWDAVQPNDHELKLTYVSKDGEENFPGTLTMEVTFSLNDKNEFKISYRGKTDKKTIVNMTHHMFVNLIGLTDPCPSIEDHIITVNANWFTPTDETLIPTGEIKPVEGTPLDFRKPKRVGDALACENDINIILGHGVDHNFVLTKPRIGEMSFAGKCVDPTTKRSMEIYTNEPGMQIYTANWHDGFKGYHGVRMPRRSGIAFETQHFPDSPNIGHFPSVVLNPGETYVSDTIYKFGVEK